MRRKTTVRVELADGRSFTFTGVVSCKVIDGTLCLKYGGTWRRRKVCMYSEDKWIGCDVL